MNLKICLELFVLISCVFSASGIITRKKFKFTGKNKFRFISKFAVGAGNMALFQIRARVVKPYDKFDDKELKIKAYIYDDHAWENVEGVEGCTDKRNFATETIELTFRGDSNYGPSISFPTTRDSQTRLWYIATADCEGRTHVATKALPKIEVELTQVNGDSQFSEEYSYILSFTFATLIVLVGLFGNSLLKFYNEYKVEKNLENPMIILMVGVAADIWSVFLKFIYLYLVYTTGEGYYMINIFDRLSAMFAQITLVWLLLMIAYGWTITYKTMDEKDIYIILALFVLMIHLMITALTFVDDDESHKYHDFSGVQGVIIVILRIMLFIGYGYGFYTTYTSAPNKKKEALWAFGIIATVYILSFPMLWIISSFCEPHMRRRVITFSNFSVQIVAIYCLMHQFTGKGTSYYKASEKSAGILPGSKFD